MAISSIFEEFVVSDKEKVYEIAQALKRPRDTSIRPVQPPKMSESIRSLFSAKKDGA